MSTTPRAALLVEASSVGLRIVAPPPSMRDLQARETAGPSAGLDSQYDPVLVWDLGSGLSTKEYTANKRWAQLVRSADSRARPLVCGADCELWNYSRNVDLLWISRAPLGSSLGLMPYLTWLRERPQWARGGTPALTMIQTQPAERLNEQAALLAGSKEARVAWQDEQFRLLVFSALAAGSRGICFQSSTPLDGSEPATRRRAAMLELINLELDLIEPWCASSSFVTSVTGNDADMGAAVMQTDRARLVLPLPRGPFNQFVLPVPTPPPSARPTFTKKGIKSNVSQIAVTPTPGIFSHVPGVPESNEAFELSVAGFRPIISKRVNGGVRVMLSAENRNSLVVLTQDGTVKANLVRRVERVRHRAVELERELATMHLARVDDVYARLAAKGHTSTEAQAALAGARAHLNQSPVAPNSVSEQELHARLRKCEDLLGRVERGCWELTLAPVVAPLSTALGTNFYTLPEYWQFIGEASTAPREPNLLPAGDFEDLQSALASGWHYYQHPQPKDLQRPQPGLTTSVTSTAENPHGGIAALRLAVTPTNVEQAPPQVETAPMWLVSAPVPVETGRVMLIHGWVNIPKRITGSPDGLLVIDSLSGEPLAERFLETKGWQEFSLYRAAPRAGTMTVTFALCGLGEAMLDDVSVQVVNMPAAASQGDSGQGVPGQGPAGQGPPGQPAIDNAVPFATGPALGSPPANDPQARGRAGGRAR
jgi:hypothetical protein